jgi:outer membrane protein OmpA-like peptidoglycan-associated protein
MGTQIWKEFKKLDSYILDYVFRSNSIASYDKFLTDVVSASITDGATVIIHCHADNIGEEDHNMKLSKERALDQHTLERALTKAGKNQCKV